MSDTPARPEGLAWLTARPIAHRGLHDARAGIIENMPAAFAAAIEATYSIETDLRLTADGEAMVFHDSTLDRLTEETGPISERNSRTLKLVKVRNTDEAMMTLGELTDLVAGRVPLLLELKSQWEYAGGLEDRVAQVLRTYHGPVAAMSFDPRNLERLRRVAPDLPRGIVSERFRDAHYWSRLSSWQRFRLRHMLHAPVTRPDFIAYDVRGLPSAAPLLARYMFGKPLLTWTVRSQKERRCARWFANQMIFEGFRP